MEGVSYSVSLKNEIKKKEFIDYFTKKFEGTNIDHEIYNVVLVLCKAAEQWFATSKTKRKLGNVKKEAVLQCLSLLNHTQRQNKEHLSQIVESIVQNTDLKPNSLIYYVFRVCFKKVLSIIKR